MIGSATTIYCQRNNKICVKVLPGHFAMTHAHTNFYVDVMEAKQNTVMAEEAAAALTENYEYNQAIDTIVCLDGSEVIGAFMAKKLSQGGMFAVNNNADIYVVSPDNQNIRQMIFRDNTQPMIAGKRVLVLCGSLITGKNVRRAIQCVSYYGGTVVGVAAVFSTKAEFEGLAVGRLFSENDVKGYEAYDYVECPECKAGKRIDAMANSYGYSKI